LPFTKESVITHEARTFVLIILEPKQNTEKAVFFKLGSRVFFILWNIVCKNNRRNEK